MKKETSPYLTIVFLAIFLFFWSFFVNFAFAETKEVKCLSQINNISQQVFIVHIFHFKLEAENFAEKNNGIVLKEQGEEIYRVFFKKDLNSCVGQNFIWVN